MTDRELPTGTVTFLFSDIEGSTRLLQKLGRENYAAVLDQHNLLFRESLGAAVVSTEGDSFFCAFDTPGVAVQGAIDVQRAIHGERWLDGTELWVRMGLHTGEGILGGDNYVGLDVHKAARISAAKAGRTTSSLGPRRHPAPPRRGCPSSYSCPYGSTASCRASLLFGSRPRLDAFYGTAAWPDR